MKLPIFEENETWEEVTESETGTVKLEKKTKTKLWRFKDPMQETWHIIEQIYDHQNQLLTAPGIGLRGTDRDKLEGFSFRDIVQGENPLRLRIAYLKPSGRGWVDFTREICAITLLARNFGELMEPADDANSLCCTWRRVTKGEDYLVARVSTLEEICTKNGNKDSNPLELARGIYWHKGMKLFEQCSNCKQNISGATCDRVQLLLPRLSIGFKTCPEPFENTGGVVVFGRSPRYRWHWRNTGDPVEVREDEAVVVEGSSTSTDNGGLIRSSATTSLRGGMNDLDRSTSALDASVSSFSRTSPLQEEPAAASSRGGTSELDRSTSALDASVSTCSAASPIQEHEPTTTVIAVESVGRLIDQSEQSLLTPFQAHSQVTADALAAQVVASQTPPTKSGSSIRCALDRARQRLIRKVQKQTNS